MEIAPKKKSNTTGRTVGQTKSANNSANQSNLPLTKQELDDLQALIGLLGFLLGLGIGADLINAAISAIRGDFAGALFDLLSAIPAIDDAAKGAKVIQDIDKYLGVVNRLQNTVIKKIPNKTIANKLQKVLNEAKEELNKQKSTRKKQEAAKGNNNQQTTKSTQKDATVTNNKHLLKCGEFDKYGKLTRETLANGYERDHVPSKAGLVKYAQDNLVKKGVKLTKGQKDAIGRAGLTIAIPKQAHKDVSRTYGRSRNTDKQITKDAKDLVEAAKKDTEAISKELDKYEPRCKKAYDAAAKIITSKTKADYDKILKEVLEQNNVPLRK